MAQSQHRVLLIEDTESLARVYQAYLKESSVSVEHVTTFAQAKESLVRQLPSLVLLDLHLPDQDGIELLRMLHNSGCTVPVIVITANSSVETAVEAMRLGAYDFVTKPVEARRLQVTVHNALNYYALNRLVDQLENRQARASFHQFVGASTSMQAVYQMIERSARSRATVFVLGESGTGKELCAEALHQESARKENPFIPLNCAAIPKELVESELFGHVKGAFTGAQKERQGAVMAANGGTLFLDEICEMELDLQAKLLRFLQTSTIQPVGSDERIKVDVRIVCASNRDPWKEVEEGRFREDLYYRLHVLPIHLPPLRQRGDDILLLAKRFLQAYGAEEGKRFVGFSRQAEWIMSKFGWPGNVRQLQNLMRQLAVIHPGGKVASEDLPPPLNKVACDEGSEGAAQFQWARPPQQAAVKERAEATVAVPEPQSLADIERQAIEEAIERCNGNITQAANLLEVSPSTIYRKMQVWQQA
ncbi:sigma-54 dependent transcriptional regulator [Ferrimonas sp. YFM]|uniref:sigma-54-dependent transcriptional regulator n=1 Tax=Ferrimonas sp. YFM TaxID=3028878 RepID=UPI002572F2CC|nr:sigma-54 dependent transcriptional regulator [Ferrimonas sp. YFM]BDY04933.1 sigma-54-dependent Fis family transcriptional regulator [Ferrimonas sp. YFM]